MTSNKLFNQFISIAQLKKILNNHSYTENQKTRNIQINCDVTFNCGVLSYFGLRDFNCVPQSLFSSLRCSATHIILTTAASALTSVDSGLP